ncbi:hypothetical protein HK099_007850 [Clydaea vesicula]|uniref:Protein root UVB sensitive/RUS domain-containing protein n=1 Tax=Clydaea vesicula TaxID=447962 RepID=A0AAD5U7Z0_9FUNG|nr:hypothetical protein HK099_007850 [Clydaea vesicula]
MQHYRTLSNSLILKKASRYRCNSIIFLSSYKNLKKENNLNNQKFKSEINYKNLILLQNQNGKFGQEAAYSKVIEKDSKDNNLVEKLSTLSMQALLQSMGMGAGSAIGLASISNIGKNIGWLATSATRVSMNRGVTREDNLGDVTAKSGAQSTAAGLIGTGFGVVLSYFVGVEPLTLMAVFIPSTILNMYFAYKTNTSVVVKTFNLERGEICLREFCEKIVSSHFEKYNNVKKLEKNKLDFSIINSKKVEQNFLKFKNLLKDPSEVGNIKKKKVE